MFIYTILYLYNLIDQYASQHIHIQKKPSKNLEPQNNIPTKKKHAT